MASPLANLVRSPEAQHSSAKSLPQPCSKQHLPVGTGDLTLPISSYPTSSTVFHYPVLHSGVFSPFRVLVALPPEACCSAGWAWKQPHICAFGVLPVTGSTCKFRTVMTVIVHANRWLLQNRIEKVESTSAQWRRAECWQAQEPLPWQSLSHSS